jgi:DNA-binding Lrp family transcriptional regulator
MKEDEKEIMMELQKNSNESLDVLAKRVGFSRQKIWRIVNRLEAAHSIWGNTAILDESELGFKHFTALIKRPGEKLENVYTGGMLSIESSYYVQGEYDWVITFAAKDIFIAKKFCREIEQSGLHTQVTLLETLHVSQKQYVKNPDAKKLKELL